MNTMHESKKIQMPKIPEEEKTLLVSQLLKVSDYINVDDTGARHDGKNGYCTNIGNRFFTWFQSTGSKRWINFLDLIILRNINKLKSCQELTVLFFVWICL